MIDMIDINDRTKTPCVNQSLGCPVPNFHICLLGKEDRTDEFPELQKAYVPGRAALVSRAGTNGRAIFGSPEHIAKVSATQKKKWEEHHARNADRNREIVSDYDNGLGIRQLRLKYGLGHGTVVKILHKARDAGELVIRTRGYMEFGQQVRAEV